HAGAVSGYPRHETVPVAEACSPRRQRLAALFAPVAYFFAVVSSPTSLLLLLKLRRYRVRPRKLRAAIMLGNVLQSLGQLVLTAVALSQLQQQVEITSILSTAASVVLMIYSGIQVRVGRSRTQRTRHRPP